MRTSPLLLALLLATPLAHAAEPTSPTALGWVEKVRIAPEDIIVKAKLDTGAKTSSMHAENIERFERDGEEWVRFTVAVEDADDNQVARTFERPLVRDLTVRGAAGKEDRPVVTMDVCIGHSEHTEQFSLNDRDDMVYPVLIGRRTIADLGAVDVERTFTTEPECGGGEGGSAAELADN